MVRLVSNDEIEDKALELIKLIKDSNDYKEYLKVKKKI